MKFSGKKLLMLGSNVGATDMAAYAKLEGAKVYVADYLESEQSAAKRIADVPVLCSTADVDALDELVKNEGIDGVLAGISEFNLLNAMELCERNGLPFYCTREQWEAVSEKDKFRDLCKQYGVPCPRTYFDGVPEETDWIRDVLYPCVLKPVDASTSAGVHICATESELLAALPDALGHSRSGRIIVESFEQGDEFTAHFTVRNGHAELACMDNRYPVAVHGGRVTTVPVARLYPSLFLEPFQEQVAPAIERMLEGIGLQNAVMFVQGLFDAEAGSFAVFEAGMRSAAEAPGRFLERTGGRNYLELLVDQALGVDPVAAAEDPSLGGTCCGVVSFVTTGGTVGSIEGLEEAVRGCPSVIQYESRYPVGTVAPSGDTLRQLMIRFVMACDSREQMARDIAFLNERVTVLDDRGNNMVLKMNPERVWGAS